MSNVRNTWLTETNSNVSSKYPIAFKNVNAAVVEISIGLKTWSLSVIYPDIYSNIHMIDE